MTKSELRLALEAAVDERHCADHPLWEELAAGRLKRAACMGWAIEHYHWISNMLTEATFQICSKCKKLLEFPYFSQKNEDLRYFSSRFCLIAKICAKNENCNEILKNRAKKFRQICQPGPDPACWVSTTN